MAKHPPREVRVFIASPGDVASERRAFRDLIDTLNVGFGDGAGVVFVPLGWEDTLSSVGRRSQSLINADIDECEIFLLVLFRRWGQDAADSSYSSYTEEEFHRALYRFRTTGSPEIFVFFKDVDSASLADPGPQLSRVVTFRSSLEESRQVIYRSFVDTSDFSAQVDRHLRAYVKGELQRAITSDEIILPIEYFAAVEAARKLAADEAIRLEKANRKAEAMARRAEELAFALANEAGKLAKAGRIEAARELFAKSLAGTNDIRVLYLAHEFYKRTGEIREVENVLNTWLAVSGEKSETGDTAAALGNLALVSWVRGDKDKSLELLQKALLINEKLGRVGCVAVNQLNIGLVLQQQGKCEEAEGLFREASTVYERLGDAEGNFRAQLNLADNLRVRGLSDRAEVLYRSLLRIAESARDSDKLQVIHNDLGRVLMERGEVKQAEEHVTMGLRIAEAVANKEGVAAGCRDLGLIAEKLGKVKEAEELHKRSLEIFTEIGSLSGIASQTGNLATIHFDRGQFNLAEQFLRRSLEIYIHINDRLQMAVSYRNLGHVCKAVGDRERARDHWRQAHNEYMALRRTRDAHDVEQLMERL